MQQFDIVENLNVTTRARYPYVVVLQHDRIAGFSTLAVAPVTAATPDLLATKLHPEISVEGQSYALLIEELAAVHRRGLGRVIGEVTAERHRIIAALDLLFTGI